MQGEADGGNLEAANDYDRLLTCFINDVRKDLNHLSLPFVIGLISETNVVPYHEIIRSKQILVGSSLAESDYIETKDIPMNDDTLHYSSLGQMILGDRFADKLLKLIRI
jgi:hypothetical protein